MRDRTKGRIADIVRGVYDEMEELREGQAQDHELGFVKLIWRFIEDGILPSKINDYCRQIDDWLDERKGQRFTTKDLLHGAFSFEQRDAAHFRAWFGISMILMLHAGRMSATEKRDEFYMTRL